MRLAGSWRAQGRGTPVKDQDGTSRLDWVRNAVEI